MTDTWRESSAGQRSDGQTLREAEGLPSGDGSVGSRTVREGAGLGSGGTGAPEGVQRLSRVDLVPSLRDRFRLVNDLGRGGEGDVVLAADGTDQQWVVKQYAPGWSPKEDVLARLIDAHEGRDLGDWAADSRWASLLWLEDWGTDPSWNVFYEVQEYLPGGSLADLTRWPIPQLVSGLAGAVDVFHEVVGPHRDVKPANVLVRDDQVPTLVLVDIGLARTLEASQRFSGRDGSAAYQAPEAAQRLVSRSGDWWSVGMLVAQAALGYHPCSLPDGSLPDDVQLLSELAQRDVPHLDQIDDERVQLLCRGLLTRDSEHRWGAEQVRQWLSGGSPAVVVQAVSTRPQSEPSGPARQVLFGGQDYASPQELAAAFAADPFTAGSVLFEAKDQVLREDLRLLLGAHGLHEAQSLIASYQSGPWQPTFLRLLAEMNPQLPPMLAGQSMTPADLAALASGVIAQGGASRGQAQSFGWVVRHDLWRIWRGLPGMNDAPPAAAMAAGINSDLKRYAPEGRQLVADGSGAVVMTGLDLHRIDGGTILVEPAGLSQYVAAAQPLTDAWCVFAAVEPETATQALDGAIKQALPHLEAQRWWTGLANGSQSQRIAAVTMLGIASETQQTLVQELATRADQAEKARQAAKAAEITERAEPWRRRTLQQIQQSERLAQMFRIPSVFLALWLFWTIVCLLLIIFTGNVLITDPAAQIRFLVNLPGPADDWALWTFICAVIPGLIGAISTVTLVARRADSKAREKRAELELPLKFDNPAFRWDSEVGDWVKK